MERLFDIRGNLYPAKKTVVAFSSIKHDFVNTFPLSSSRHALFDGLEDYLLQLKQLIDQSFTVWINGSFISNRPQPQDIDLVILLHHLVINKFEEPIRSKFIDRAFAKSYGLDVYLIAVYPPEHGRYSWTLSDLAYWETWFSKTRINRRKKRYNKGFIEVRID